MLMHAALRCNEGTLSTDIWPMAMYHAVCVYNQIPDMQSGLSDIEIMGSRLGISAPGLAKYQWTKCPPHQNGAAECAIKTVVTMETTMLMHAALRCNEDTLSTDIWPMAIYYAVWV